MKNQQKKPQVLTFYIVKRHHWIYRVSDDGTLKEKEDREAATLFDDYGKARNAINRTKTAREKDGLLIDDFEIVRLEF